MQCNRTYKYKLHEEETPCHHHNITLSDNKMMIYYAISVTYNLYRLVLITVCSVVGAFISLFREAQAKRKCERYEVAETRNLFIHFIFLLLFITIWEYFYMM